MTYPQKKDDRIVYSKTFNAEKPELIDKITNEFREQKEHEVIATTVTTNVNHAGKTEFIQTLFYKKK